MKSIGKEALDRNAPFIKICTKGKVSPWLTPNVKCEMNTGDKTMRKARKTNEELDCVA